MTLIVFLIGMLAVSTTTLTVLKCLEVEVEPEPQPEPKAKLSPRERRRLRRQRDPITGEKRRWAKGKRAPRRNNGKIVA